MFVTLKKYRKAVAQLENANVQVMALSAKLLIAHQELNTVRAQRDNYCNQLVAAINNLGVSVQFTDAQLRTLLQLCHPDKHGGKDSAVAITQHINQLRGK